MVTVAQLALTQSPISSLIPSVGNTVTVKLDDSNYVTWNFQMGLLLEGNGIFGFVDGSIPCPDKYHDSDSEDETVTNSHHITDDYKVWKIHDKALMTLITATLSTAALSCVIGCQSSQEMWNNLRERFSNMTRTSIVQMKIDMQNIKKGSESIDLYLQQIKDCRDQLAAVGVFISDEDIVIVALKGLPNEFNTIKAVIRGRENLVSLKELRSQLKAEEATLDEVIKQAPIMSAMYASNSVYDAGGSSGGAAHNASQHFFNGSHFPISSTPVFQQMPFPNQMFQMNSPLACVSQGGSGTYNNFRGNNFKPKGKGKKFYTNFQQPQQTGASFPQQSSSNNFHQGSSFQSLHSPLPTEQVYQPLQICQICNRKGHSALHCFQKGCQICNRKGHTAATCFDRNSGFYSMVPPQFSSSSQGFSPQQFQPSQHATFPAPFPPAHMVHPLQFHPAMMSSQNHSPVAMTSRSTSSPSAPQQEYWLLDSGATHHMTSDLSNIQMAAHYSSSDTVTGANGEGLHIAHIGHSTLPLQSHNLCLKSVLHDKVTQEVLYRGLSNNVHCRLGHPAPSVVKAALSKADISFKCLNSSYTCKACLQGKFANLPFPSLASKSVVPFEVIHTDVWGPSPSLSIEGYRYYVSFIDESFIDECTRILQSDGGGEYIGINFQNFLKDKGILHHKSCPYTPQQNGLVERKNRHITETAITLLQQACLPPQFWYHVCATAVYLINRMPTLVLSMKSPFEMLYHSSPKLDHLKIFGCACYPSLKPYRSHKLAPKTSECIFLGYAAQYKGFICFNPKDNKLIVSRHVLFDESHFPATHMASHFDSGSKVTSISSTVPSNTFHHPPLASILFPQVFSRDSSSPHSLPVCSSTPSEFVSSGTIPSLPGDISMDHMSSAAISGPVMSELHPDTHLSQVSELQPVSVAAVNSHPMQLKKERREPLLKKPFGKHETVLRVGALSPRQCGSAECLFWFEQRSWVYV
ncbi:hypothetical protein ACFX2C_024187 [Malus domestica]